MAAVIKIEINSSSGGKGIDDATRSLKDLEGTASKAGGGVSSFGQVAIGALREVGAVAVTAMASAGMAIGGFVKDSISAAGDFEAGMNLFAAASGTSGDELAKFGDLFIQLGKDLPVSTKQVEDAATAMVKGGIDPAIVAGGALKDTLQFSLAAGFATLDEAAEASAKILGSWGDASASAADQTAFLSHAQELLVRSANASTLDADKLADAMLMAGGSAQAAGVNYDEFVTIMGATAKGFASAAVQGSSFNNFFTRLIPSTTGAKDAMQALGLYTEETGSAFYDANGKFVGMAKASQLMQDAFGPLTDAQRSEAMATIFGNDAKNSAIQVMKLGVEGYDAFSASMANANGIAAQGAATQTGFNFAMQNMQGSIEALQITIGSKLLPMLTPLISQFTAGINVAIEFASGILGAADPVAALSAQFPILGQAITVATTAFNGIYAFVQSVMPSMMGIIQSTLTIVSALWNEHGAQWMQQMQSVFTIIQGVIQVVMGVIQGILAVALGLITGDWTTAMTQIQSANETIWNGIKNILMGILDNIAAYFGTTADAVLTNWATGLAQLSIATTKAVDDALVAMTRAIAPAVDIGKSIIDGMVSGISSAAGSLASAAADAAKSALDAAKSALGIESPSKVFAAQVGMPMAQGMAVGLQQGAPLVAGAAQGVAGAAVAGAQTNVTNYNYSPNYSSTPNRPSQDFSMMRSLATAGT